MSIKLNDTQLVLLSAASQRDDHCLMLPKGARLAPARKATDKLLAAGFVREILARKDAPIWRREEDTERAFALKLTAAGLKAIAADIEGGADAPQEEQRAEDAKPTRTSSRRHTGGGAPSISLEAPVCRLRPEAEPRSTMSSGCYFNPKAQP